MQMLMEIKSTKMKEHNLPKERGGNFCYSFIRHRDVYRTHQPLAVHAKQDKNKISFLFNMDKEV